VAFLYLAIKKPKFEIPPKWMLLLFGAYIILNMLIIRTVSVHIMYLAVTVCYFETSEV